MAPRPRRHRLPFAPAHHCRVCGTPIDAHQAVGGNGVCDRFECRAAEVRRRQAEDRALEARRRDRARDRLEAEGVDPGTESWSVTPANDAGPVPLSDERREDFLAHLRRMVQEAVEMEGAGRPDAVEEAEARLAMERTDELEGRRFGPPTPEEGRALAAGCATCRGWCCRQGGTHAFLDAGRIRRLLAERPDLEADAVAGLYASHLADTHLRGGCVFQGTDGCRLPRALRSDTCNDYFCPDLVEVRRRFRRGDAPGIHRFVAIQPGADRAEDVGATPLPDDL